MAEWGRKEYSKAWPSRTPVWTWTAILLTFQYERSWTAAERLYLTDYMKSGARGKASATAASKYTLLEAVVGKGQRLVIGDEIEEVPAMDGRPGYRLTNEGVTYARFSCTAPDRPSSESNANARRSSCHELTVAISGNR
jgi:hypothetical protein